jgi:hypothetical protein
MFEISQLFDIANKLSAALELVKPRLLGQPDTAAEKLAEALNEISKIFQFVDAKLVEYLSITCKPNGDNLGECRLVLLSLESGILEVQGNEARGHCHKITNIYQKYLNAWFKKLLDDAEQQQIKDIFNGLGNMDEYMTSSLKRVTLWLTDQAHETLNLLDDEKVAEANARIRSARQETLPVRREIAKTLSSLRGLQADFIAASGTV